MGIDIATIVLGIMLLVVFLVRCILDWIELRDEWWDMIDTEDDDTEVDTGGGNE